MVYSETHGEAKARIAAIINIAQYTTATAPIHFRGLTLESLDYVSYRNRKRIRKKIKVALLAFSRGNPREAYFTDSKKELCF